MENPLINTYKLGFIFRRVMHTFLGGPRLILGFRVPCYIYLLQIMFFVWPLLMGCASVALIHFNRVTATSGMLLCGSVISATILTLQLLAHFSLNKHATVTKINKTNLLSEVDEVEFTSLLSLETLEFLFPQKRGKLGCILCAILSGLLCSLSVGFLLPSHIRGQHADVKFTIILFAFGWLTVCIAQYSLTAANPPEPAPFQAVDHLVTTLTRPTYTLAILIIFHVAWLTNNLNSVGISLHLLFCALPFLWLFGVLPPLDALFLWLGEQLLVFVFGGSYMASTLWLLGMLLISSCEILILACLQHWVLVAAFAAPLGYILSIDLRPLIKTVQRLTRRCFHSKSYNEYSKNCPQNQHHGTNSGSSNIMTSMPVTSCNSLNVMLHISMVIMCTSLTLIRDLMRTDKEFNSTTTLPGGHLYFGLVFTVSYIVLTFMRLVHGVYFFGGLVRNYWYPRSLLNSPPRLKEWSRKLAALHILSTILYKFVLPFTMVVDISIYGETQNHNCWRKILLSMAAARAFRQVWQHTDQALLELAVVHFLNECSSVLTSLSLDFLLSLLVVGFILRRLHQFCLKLYVVIVLMVTSVTMNSDPFIWVLVVLDIILSPVVLAVVFLSAMLSAPLLPLFTLPLFLEGFPRPLKFWPGKVGKTENTCSDTVYYEQLVPRFAESLSSILAKGSLGYLEAGDYLLARYQDRLIWVQFLERGYNYYTVNIKGLELQETSCHSVEATRVDTIFEHAFNPLEEKGQKVSWCNPYFMDCLTPCDIIPVRTYSDARNILTGLIDSPDTLQLITQYFPQVLLWVLLLNAVRRFQDELHVHRSDEKELDEINSLKSAGSRPPSEQSQMFVQKITKLKPSSRRSSNQSLTEITGLREDRRDSGPKELNKPPEKWAQVIRSGSIGSLLWSDDEDTLESSGCTFKKYLKGDDQEKQNASALIPRISQSSSSVASIPGQPENTFTIKVPDSRASKKESANVRNAWTSDASLIERATHFKTNYAFSESSRLGPRREWISSSNLYLHSKDTGGISEQWFHSVLKYILDSNDSLKKAVGEKVLSDQGLYKAYKHLIIECHQYVNTHDDIKNSPHPDPQHVYQMFAGNFTDSAVHEWIKKDKELSDIILKAYRYTVKLALDQSLLGHVTNDEELKEYLQDYTSNWHIGKDSDDKWKEAVLSEREFVFSMSYSEVQNTYSSHLLSLQEIPVFVGYLNSAVVQSIWSTLALELLYLTNDDEERYSIQAHPTILRNLTVQAADIPLGYPIYNSPPITLQALY